MPLELTSDEIKRILDGADAQSLAEGPELVTRLGWWTTILRSLLAPSSPLTYLPVLCVCLVARAASDSVDVRRIKPGADYSADLVGKRLIEFARDHEVDMRTFTSNVMNSQPFIRQPAITAGLAKTAEYRVFFEAVERVQDLTSEQAGEVLALALHLGRENWPNKVRRVQRNQAQPALPLDHEQHYFILNQSPHEDYQHYDGEGYYGFHANVTSAKALVSAGSGRFVLYRTSDAKDSPMTFVGAGRIESVEEHEQDAEGRATWRARVVDWEPFDVPVAKASGAPTGWNSQNSISRITQEAFDRIVRLGRGDVDPVEPLTVQALRSACTDSRLLIGDEVLAALVGALDSGKHVVLTGPPGTAKTTLAVLVARLATEAGHCRGHTTATATADWSTYDTIGGLSPQSDGTLVFRYGLFLQALQDSRWLIVDELNRSNFDRAFGPLFTVLAGEDVVLQHRHPDDGRVLRVRHASHPCDEQYHDVVVEDTWRMVATINNFDKALLFEMSFALMRRFAFVEVPPPTPEQYLHLIDTVLADDPDTLADNTKKAVTPLLPLRQVKEIGPAIFIDATRMARSMLRGPALPAGVVTLAVFYALLLPQFEGIEEAEGHRLLRALSKAVGAGQAGRARAMLREVLGLDLGHAAGLQEDDAGLEDTGLVS